MKNTIKYIFFILLTCLVFTVFANGQGLNFLRTQCPSPNDQLQSSFALLADGNINAIPCPSGTFQINGLPIPTASSIIAGSVTATFIPYATGVNTLANSPNIWTGTSYTWNNTALNSEFTQTLTPSTTVGRFQVGDFTTTPTNFIDLNQATNQLRLTAVASINANTNAGVFSAGDLLGVSDSTVFSVSDATDTFGFSSGGTTPVIDFQTIKNFKYTRTITAAGTTGNRTINTVLGTVNFAAAATDIVVTNSGVLTTSLIFCTVQSLDTTAISCRITDKAAGSFHIRIPAATAETSVAFQVTN